MKEGITKFLAKAVLISIYFVTLQAVAIPFGLYMAVTTPNPNIYTLFVGAGLINTIGVFIFQRLVYKKLVLKNE